MKKAQAKKILDELISKFADEMNIINFNTHLANSAFKKNYDNFLSHKYPIINSNIELPIMGTNINIMNPFNNSKSVSFGGLHASGPEVGDLLIDNLNGFNRLQIVLAFETIARYYFGLYAAFGYLDKNLWSCEDFGEIRMKDVKNKKLDWFKNQVIKSKSGKKITIKKILKSIRNNFSEFEVHEKKGDVFLRLWIFFVEIMRNAIVHNQSILPLDIYHLLEKSGYSFVGRSALNKKSMIERYLEYKNDHYEILTIKSRDVKPPYHFLSKPTQEIINKLCMHSYLAYNVTIKHFGQTSIWNTGY